MISTGYSITVISSDTGTSLEIGGRMSFGDWMSLADVYESGQLFLFESPPIKSYASLSPRPPVCVGLQASTWIFIKSFGLSSLIFA